MNPNAKEFVPAHLLKRRQEEGDQLAEKVGQVDLDDSTKNKSEPVTNNTGGDQATTNNSAKDIDTTESSDKDQLSNSQHNHSNNTSNHSDSNHHNSSNGQTTDLEDRHLLKAGESYCEFNGEQFIIPGEDGEYEPEYQPDYKRNAGYDFGNAEDNEDEDVCNAYEQFLDNLPE